MDANYHGWTEKELIAKRDEVHARIGLLLHGTLSSLVRKNLAQAKRERAAIEGLLEAIWEAEAAR